MAVVVDLDQDEYTPGEEMVLTVRTGPGERDTSVRIPFTVAVNIPGVGEGEASAVLVQPGPLAPVIVTDATRTWAPADDDGETASFTATA